MRGQVAMFLKSLHNNQICMNLNLSLRARQIGGRRNLRSNEIIPILYRQNRGSSIPTWSGSGLHANLIGTRNDRHRQCLIECRQNRKEHHSDNGYESYDGPKCFEFFVSIHNTCNTNTQIIRE